ncbi:MAG: hypothetical protein M3Y80_02310 [Verrucomicrobiota bacterium]|nr:hypothetical protein [Verrucomicrobiota bacterium]
MRFSPRFFACLAALLLVRAGSAQQVALPQPDASPTASPAAAALPGTDPLTAPVPPPQLIPDDVLPTTPNAAPIPHITSLPELDASMVAPPLSPAADAYRQQVEWRKLRNQVQNDADVKAAFAEAQTARTDLEKRRLLARYIELSYRKMMARGAAEMKPFLEARKQEALGGLPQPNVRPTPKPAKGTAVAAAKPAPVPTPTATPDTLPAILPTIRR